MKAKPIQHEAVEATLRRYREWCNAARPSDWPCALAFAQLERGCAGAMKSDAQAMLACRAVEAIWKHLRMGRPSNRTITRIISTLAQ